MGNRHWNTATCPQTSETGQKLVKTLLTHSGYRPVKTSCAAGHHDMPPPSASYSPGGTCSGMLAI